MPNFLSDNPDLLFYLQQEINWDELVPLVETQLPAADGPKSVHEAQESYLEILNTIGDFAANQIGPVAAELDRAGVAYANGEVTFPAKLAHIFSQLKEMGLHGMSMPRELGGLNCPILLNFIAQELIARADVSVMTHFGFHGAIALALMQYSLEEGSATLDAQGRITHTRFDQEIGEIVAGSAWGSMDITEPNAGSDMAQLSSRAELGSDGRWRITGQKIFITSGHGKYHIVIARSEPNVQAGLRGLSLFLVPLFTENSQGKREYLAQIDRIEEKIGHHASPTCSIQFDKTPAYLIGQRGEGFKYMLMLMNNARLGVGFEAIGICEAAYRTAKDYAANRRSMGKTIDQHELIYDYLDEMSSDIVGLRTLAIYGAFYEEVSQKLHQLELAKVGSPGERKQRQQRMKEAAANARRMIPLLKYLAAEKAVEMARRCMQIHGGVGYTKDYGAEKLLRDALVAPIYEGTSQIQSLMVMKDTLGWVMKKPQQFFRKVARARWLANTSQDHLVRRVAKMQIQANRAIVYLLQKTVQARFADLRKQPMTSWLKSLQSNWDPKRDFSFAMLHAERLTRILADVTICELLLEQSTRHPQRRVALQRYLGRAEIRVKHLRETIELFGENLVEALQKQATANPSPPPQPSAAHHA